MLNKIYVFLLLVLTGCDFRGDLESQFAGYFRLLNTSEDIEEIHEARQDLEDIVVALKQENNIHLQDFGHLLNLYRSFEIAHTQKNPEKTRRIIRIALHPANNGSLLEKYQKAESLPGFNPILRQHQKALKRALNICENTEISHNNKTYSFNDIIKKWSELKKFNNSQDQLAKISQKLKLGYCFGLAHSVNNFVCKNKLLDPVELSKTMLLNLDKILAPQIQLNIASKVRRKNKDTDAESYFIADLKQGSINSKLIGFKLREDVIFFIDNYLKKSLRQNKDFVAEVFFGGNKTGHAVAIQVLNNQKEFRIIDNNIGVLSFGTKREFLETFAYYRSAYYENQARTYLEIFGRYCS